MFNFVLHMTVMDAVLFIVTGGILLGYGTLVVMQKMRERGRK